MRHALLALVLLALTGRSVWADPGVEVTYRDGFLRLALEGSYAGTYYQVWRSTQPSGDYAPLASDYALCTGDCFVFDLEAVPGRTYYYRFDLIPPSADPVQYGPYAILVPNPPLAARLWPNPGSGSAHVELSIPGARWDAPVEIDVRVLDLQGRTVSRLHHGPIARGVSSLTWNGRADSGQDLAAGLYFLRIASSLGNSSSRVIRVR